MALKKFKICNFDEISNVNERSSNYLYLAYDRLILFMGKNPYYDHFIICDTIPEKPIIDCLYILMNGDVKLYDEDNGLIDIARIEDESQLEELKKVGSVYFVRADERYIDWQRRTLQLPYHNGTYSMSVTLAKDLKINDRTIIRYDQTDEHWYIGGEYDEDLNFDGYSGSDTNTVTINVQEYNISANVKVSETVGNILTADVDGLYANVDNLATIDEFNELKDKFNEYKKKTDDMIKVLEDIMDGEIISEDTIYSLIVRAVHEYSDELADVIDQFQDIEDRLRVIKERSKEYTDETFKEHKEEMTDAINKAFASSIWAKF